MSNRIERTNDRKTVEKHQRILKDLLAQPQNKICADCKKRDPRWASANLGIFICLRCSGIHRSLGVHISKVRSVDLDTWIPEHIEVMTRWGNARANKYWEAQLPADYTPEEARVETYIRNKYEYKKYAQPGPMPEPETLDGLAAPPSNATAQPAAAAPMTLSNGWQQVPPPQQAPPPAPTADLWADFAKPSGNPASFGVLPVPTLSQPPAATTNVTNATLQPQAASQTAKTANILSLYAQQPPPVASNPPAMNVMNGNFMMQSAPSMMPQQQQLQQQQSLAFSGFGTLSQSFSSPPQQPLPQPPSGMQFQQQPQRPSPQPTQQQQQQQQPYMMAPNQFGAFGGFQTQPMQQPQQQQQQQFPTMQSGFGGVGFGGGFSQQQPQQPQPQQPQLQQPQQASAAGFGTFRAAPMPMTQPAANEWSAFQ